MYRYAIYLLAASLAACASSPIQKMSLKDAVNFGSDQYYNTPNYAFESSTQIDGMAFGNQMLAKSTTNFDVGAMFNRLSKHISFDIKGVIDQPRKLYEIVPSYRYTAKNVQANISFPMAYDGNQQAFWIDVSALDILLSKPENEGKYSRFDVSQLNDKDKSDKLIKIIQKYTRSTYNNMPEAAFTELSLNNDDKRMSVVRKIQVDANLASTFNNSTEMMKELVELMRPDAIKDTEAMNKELTEMSLKSKEIISPDSKQVSVLSFDKDGHIIKAQSNLDLAFGNKTTSDDNLRVKAVSTSTMHSIGHAQLTNPPTADNSVDGLDNFRGSALGKFFPSTFTPKEKSTDEMPAPPSPPQKRR